MNDKQGTLLFRFAGEVFLPRWIKPLEILLDIILDENFDNRWEISSLDSYINVSKRDFIGHIHFEGI